MLKEITVRAAPKQQWRAIPEAGPQDPCNQNRVIAAVVLIMRGTIETRQNAR